MDPAIGTRRGGPGAGREAERMETHAGGGFVQERLHAAVAEACPVGLALFRGSDLRLAWCNPTYRSYFAEADDGAPELIGRRLDEYAPREIAAGVMGELQRTAESGRSSASPALEFRGLPWGTTWWRYLLAPVELEGERHVLATVVEITVEVLARHRAEAKLGQEERQHEETARQAAVRDATLAAVAEGMVRYDAEGRIVRINDAARELLGFTDQELSRPLAERAARRRLFDREGAVVPPEEFAPRRALAGESFRGVIYGLDRPDGSRIWVSVSAAPIELRGRRIGAVLTLTDVTRQRQMQDDLADLLRMVSHDLRTPLTAIQIRAQQLGRILEGRGRDSAQAIVAGCRRMNAMIQDLVEWGRLGVGLIEITPVPVDLVPFVTGLLTRNAGAIDAARVEVAIPPELPPLRADPERLERVVLNLVGNALKFSPPGAPVRIEARAVDGGVAIRVVDRGPGIPPEDVERIFERFFRSQAGGKVEGLGLGLFIARRLVEAHGGRISVESEVGRGTCFEVRIPTA